MAHTYDAAIVGAGIAGSAMAKALADRGWETLLLDRQSFPRHKVCGEFLSPEAQTTLRGLGLLDDVYALQPSRIVRIRLFFSQGKQLDIELPGTALGVSRYLLDEALHHAAQRSGVHVQTHAAVRSVQQSVDGYAIEMKRDGDSSVVQAKAVIAACGANARLALTAASSSKDSRSKKRTKPTNQTFMGIKSHYQNIMMEPVVELYLFPGGYVGVCPIENGRTNVAALLTQGAFQHTDKTITGMITAAARMNLKLGERLAQGTPVIGTQAAVSPVVLTGKPLTWSTIPLLGDAATMIPPLCGDGMSMALRSAQVCTPLADRFLRGELSLQGWQEQYERAIKQEFYGPLRWGRFLQWLFGVPIIPHILPSLTQIAPVLTTKLVQATRLRDSRE